MHVKARPTPYRDVKVRLWYRRWYDQDRGYALVLHEDAATHTVSKVSPPSIDYIELPTDHAPLRNPGGADADHKADDEAKVSLR